MKVTMVNAGFPVPAVHSGPIAQTIHETALTVQYPQMTVISPWSDDLENLVVPPDVFYHVDVDAQKKLLKNELGDQMWHRVTASQGAWRLRHRRVVRLMLSNRQKTSIFPYTRINLVFKS